MKDVPRLTHYSVLELFLLFPAPCWVFNLCCTVWKTSHRESLRGVGPGHCVHLLRLVLGRSSAGNWDCLVYFRSRLCFPKFCQHGLGNYLLFFGYCNSTLEAR